MQSQQNIVLVNDSRLLRGILKRAIQHEEELNVVAEVDDLAKLTKVIDHAGADWIILFQKPEDALPDIINQALMEKQDLKLLIMVVDGGRVRLRWIETHEKVLEEENLQEMFLIMRKNGVKNKRVNYH